MPRHRRRVRLRQDDDRAVHHAAAPAGRAHHRRQDRAERAGDLQPQRRPDAARPGQRDRHDLPGPDDVAEPDDDHRRPDLGDREAAPRRGRQDRPGAGHRGAPAGGHAPPGGAGGQLPAPAVRRDAAAGDDRHGAGLRAQAAHRGRADHRPGRHHPEADPGAHRRPAQAARDGGHPGHPRPRRHRRPGRPGGGDVRGPGRGDDEHAPAVREPAAPLYRGPVRRPPGEGGGRRDPALQHPGHAAGPDQAAAGLQVRRPLPVRPGQLPAG